MSRRPGFRSQAHREDDKWLVVGLILMGVVLTALAYLWPELRVDTPPPAVLLYL